MKQNILKLTFLFLFLNMSSFATSPIFYVNPVPGTFKLFLEEPLDDERLCQTYLELKIADGGILGSIARVERKVLMGSRCAMIALYNPYVRVFSIKTDMSKSDQMCSGYVYAGYGVEKWQNSISITDYRAMKCRMYREHTLVMDITLDNEKYTYYHSPSWFK